MATDPDKSRMEDLHRRAVVVDGHADTILAVIGGHRSLGERSERGHFDLPRAREGGLDVVFMACWIETAFKPHLSLKRGLQLVDAVYREVDKYSQQISVATSVADIHRIVDSGRTAAILAIEGGEAIDGDLAVLRSLYRLGVRLITLTWNQRNDLADGVMESRTRGGLTTLGLEVVREMNSLGMVVDVSHISDAGFWDVIDTTTQPVIASHSNCRALCDHPRNLTDDQIRALGKNGGVVGVTFPLNFVDPAKPNLERLLDHVNHVVELVGPQHVGLGSDFDGFNASLEGVEDASKLPSITEGLLKRGYRDEDILLILGGNYLRVLGTVFRES